MSARCQARNQDGSPCGAAPLADQPFCRWHAPGLEAERTAWRSKGGRGRANASRAAKAMPAAAPTIDELRGTLGAAIERTLRGDLPPGVAQAVAALARAYGSLSEAARAEELANRLDALEAAARRNGAA